MEKRLQDTCMSSQETRKTTSRNALMKSLSITLMLLVGLVSNAQVTVTGDAAGAYPDLGAAITALNAITGATLTQNTVVTVAAGNAQTAPVGGYVVNVTGTSTASLSFVGSGNTISTPVQTANSILDAAIKFIGSDFVTISGFTINASAGTVKAPATNDRTEWGIAFMAASATNGCSNNTVINNTIQMGVSYVNSRGVYFGCTHLPTNATTAQLATASTGTNSFNTVRQNIIDSASVGVMFLSTPNTAAIIETGNRVSANTITLACHDAGTVGSLTGIISSLYNLSNTTARMVGIEFRNGVTGITADSNTITAATPVFTNTGTTNAFYNFRGISSSASTNPTGFTGAPNFYRGNTITFASVNNSTGGSTGIEAVVSPTTPVISNIAKFNTINLTYTSNGLTSTAQSQSMFGIDMGVAGQKTCIADSNTITLTRTMNGNGTMNVQQTGIALGGFGSSPTTTVFDTTAARGNTITIRQFHNSTTINPFSAGLNFISFNTGNGYAIATDNILTTGNDSLFTNGSVVGIQKSFVNYSKGLDFSRNTITGNHTVHPTQTFGSFTGINASGSSTFDSFFRVNNNTIRVFARKGAGGIVATDGTTTTLADKFINNNYINIFMERINPAMSLSGTGISVSGGRRFFCENNTIDRLFATGVAGTTSGFPSITGISMTSGSITNVSTGIVRNNIVDSIMYIPASTTATATITGMSLSVSTGLLYSVHNNQFTNIFTGATTTGSSTVRGLAVTSSTVNRSIRNNIFTNITNNSLGTTANTHGITNTSSSGSDTFVNNIISNVVFGLRSSNNFGYQMTTTTNASLWNNTFYLTGLTTDGGGAYGVTGVQYTTAGNLDLRNNIIHLDNAASNPGPAGTGRYAALSLATNASAGVAPTNLTAINNIYFAPNIANSFLYAEGVATTAIIDTFSVRNDAAFNINCGTYKTFMAGRDLGSVTANIPVTVTNGVVTPTTMPNLADNNAVVIPTVTTDFTNATRGTFPDIGAVEFTSTAPIDQAGPSISAFTLPNLICRSRYNFDITITDNSGVDTSAGNKPRLYLRNLTVGANDTTGWKFIEPISISGSTFTFAIDSATFAPFNLADQVEYFLIARDVLSNVSTRTVSFASAPCPNTSVNVLASMYPATVPATNRFTFINPPMTAVRVTEDTICHNEADTMSVTYSFPGAVKIGVDGFTTTTVSPFRSAFSGQRMHYLYTAAEMKAAGYVAGPITEIDLNYTNVPLTPMTITGFSVKMENRNIASLPLDYSAITPSATTVFAPATFTAIAATGYGSNKLIFSTPFTWNGDSAIVLEFCSPAGSTGSSTQSVMAITVTTTPVVAMGTTGTLGCGLLTGFATTVKPNVMFTGQRGVSTGLTYNWTYNNVSQSTLNPFPANPAFPGSVATMRYKVDITDARGCKVTDSTIDIVGIPVPVAPTATNITKCGVGVVTTPAVTDATVPAVADAIYKWYKKATDVTPLQVDTARFWKLTTAIGVDTFFVSVTNPLASCEGPKTMVIYTSTTPPDTLKLFGNTKKDSFAVCNGSILNITTTQTPTTGSFNSFTLSASDYVNSGMSAPVVNTTGNLSVTPLATGVYNFRLDASGPSGCSDIQFLKIYVIDTVNVTDFGISSDTVCVGTKVQLRATADIDVPRPAQTGTSAADVISPFTSNWGSQHSQYLILASELIAAGAQPGNISRLNFNITTLGATVPHTDYTVRMKHTSLTALTTVDDPATFSTTFGPTPVTPTLGVNTLNFTNPFNWNGTSNIIIDICHFVGGGGAGANSTVSITTTPTNTVVGNRVDNATVCGTTSQLTTSNQRPTFGFFMDRSSTPGYTWNWGAPANLNTNIDSFIVTAGGLDTVVLTAANNITVGTNSLSCPTFREVEFLGVAIPAAPTAVTVNKCGVGVNTSNAVTNVSTPSFADAIYKWFKVPSGGAALQTDTLRYWNNTTPLGLDTFYVSVTNPLGGCEGPRTLVTYNTTPATDTILPRVNGIATDSFAICEGQSLAFTVTQGPGTTYTTFNWFSDSVNSGANPALVGASQTVTPAAPGLYTYTVNASGGACNASKSIKVLVSKNFFAASPLAFTSVPNPACVGTIITNSYGGASSTTPVPYCTVNQTFFTEEDIVNVTFGPLNNTTPWAGNNTTPAALVGSQLSAGGASSSSNYSNFTINPNPQFIPILPFGSTVPLSVTIDYGGADRSGAQTKAWIDWNQNGLFTDVGEEFLVGVSNAAHPQVITFNVNVTVPTTAATGQTRMRIITQEGVATPCGGASWGETEDYSVQIGIPGITYQWTSNKTGATVLSDSSKLIIALADTSVDYMLVGRAGACTDTAINNVIGFPLPLAPTTIAKSKCGVGIDTAAVVTDATVPAVAGAEFNWYKTATSTTKLQTGLTRFWNNTTVMGNDTFFVSVTNPATGCEGPRTLMIYTTTSPPDTIAPTLNGIADSTAICDGASVLLNVTQGPGTSLTTFTWFSDSINSGANPALSGPTHTITPTAPGLYTYKVTASGGGCIVSKNVKLKVDINYFAVAPTAFTSNPNPACVGTTITNNYAQGGGGTPAAYCPSAATQLTDEDITRVQYLSINNTSACASLTGSQGSAIGTADLLSDWTASTVPVPLLVPNTTDSLKVTITWCDGTVFASAAKAWIDWNIDGDFTDVGEEFVIMPVSTGANAAGTTFSVPITVPSTATFGNTRMRISVRELGLAQVLPCQSGSWGETEDYRVQVGIPNLTYQWRSNKTGTTLLSDSSKLIIPLADTSVDYILVTRSGACTDTAINTVTDNVPALAANPIIGPMDATVCDTVSLKATASNGCGPYTYAWTSTTATFIGATNDTVVRFILTGASGPKNVKFVVTDNLGAKDSLTQTINLVAPQLLTTTNDTICGSQTATLLATVNTGSDIKWYNSNASNDTIAFTGSPFTTPLLTGADTFFVEATANGAIKNVARPTAPAASFPSGSNNIGLKFRVNKQMVLDSVDVFAGNATSTSLTIGLFVEGSSTPIKTATVATTGGAKVLSGVELGWTITPGTYRILRTAASSSYHRETFMSPSPYPLNLGTSGSIDSGVSSATGAASAVEYNLFYNWRIKEVCTTPRTAVIVNAVTAPALTLNKSIDSMCSGLVSDTVKLTSTVSNYNTYTWAPAAGIAGATNAWVVNQTTPGTYKFILTGTQTSGLGCVNQDTLDFIVKAIPAAFTIAPAGPLSLCNSTVQQLVAPSGTSSMIWSATTGLFSNVSASTAYTGTDRDTVWARPNDTTKYFATATHPNGCTRVDSIVVNVTDTVTFTTQAAVLTERCAGQALSLAPVATSTSPITYQWKKNNVNITNTTSSLSIPTTVVADGGLYTLEATTGSPCSAKLSDTMRVTVFPGLSITAQPNAAGALTICQGQPFTLTSAATGQATMQWRKIVSGTTSNYGLLNDQDTTIASSTLADSGLYFVQYTLGGTCGTAVSDTVKVTVVPAAFVSTDPANTTVCQGTTATFTATTQNASGFAWTKNGTTITAGGNITITNTGSTQSVLAISNVTATDAGNYRLIAQNVGSCVADTSAIATLTINAKPAIASTTLPSTTVCAGSTMSFAVTASNNSRVVWFGGATGTDSIQNATSFTLPATAGIYSVKVIGNSPCGDTTSASVTTTVTPLATITTPVLASNTICAGSTTTVSANFTNADSVVWFQGTTRLGLGTVAGNTSTFTASTAGTYTARAFSANGCANVDSTSNTLTINAKPAIASTTLPAATVCAGTTMSFAVTASNNSRVVWFGGASGTDSIQNTTSFNLPATAGVYSVKVIGNSPCGDTTSASVTTTVTPLATITKPVLTSNPICAGSTTTVSANFTNADSVVWFQGTTRLGLGSVAGSTSTFTASTAGTYNAKAYSANGCSIVDSTSATLTINAKPAIASTTLPSATVCAGSTMSFAVTASNNSRVVWFGGASGTDSIQNTTSFNLPATAGIYSVKVIGNSPCGDTTSASVTTTVTPLATITTQPTATTVCQSSAMSFTIAASNADSIVWFRGATRVGTGTTYNVASATSVDSANYSAIAYSASGCTNATSNVVLGAVKPQATITTQPVVNTFVLTGASASVTMAASNFDSIVWFKGATRISNGATLSITNFDSATHAGAYTANVYSQSPCTNFITSTTANIIKSTCPVITTQPIGDTLCIGSTYALSVTAGAVNTYEWYKVGNTTPIATTASTTLNLNTLTSGGRYFVKLTPLTGCATTVTSDTISVGVDDSTRITVQPTASTTICAGSALNLSVTATGSGTRSFQWMNGSTNVGTNSNNYQVTTAATSDAGTYKVVVSSTSVCPSVTSNNAVVNVTPLATITKPVLTSNPIVQGTTTTVSANFTNADSVVWFQGATRLGLGTVAGSTSTRTVSAAGTYTARVYGAGACNQIDSTSTALIIQDTVVITTQTTPANQFVVPGTSFSVSTTATNFDSIVWYKDGVRVGAGTLSGNTSTYTVTNFDSAQHAGTYTAKVYGIAPNTQVVTTNGAQVFKSSCPVITLQPVGDTLCANSNYTLSVTAGAVNTYEWFKVGTATSIGSSSSLTLNNLTTSNAGSYFVKLNPLTGCAAGKNSDTVKIGVDAPIAFTTNLSATTQNFCVGQNMNLSVAVSGTGPFTYSWKEGTTNVGTSQNSYAKTTTAGAFTYNVQVSSVSGACPNETSNTANVQVNNAPSNVSISGLNSPYCVGNSLSLTANGNDVASYTWTYNSANTNGSTFTRTLAASDNGRTITLTANALAGCNNVSTTSSTITVNQEATVSVSPTSALVQTGATQTLTATTTNSPDSVVWFKDGVRVGSGATYTITGFDSLTHHGTYVARAYNKAPCSGFVASSNVNVFKTTCPAIAANGQPVGDTICEGSSFTLNVSAVAQDGYQWYRNNQLIANATNASYNVSNASNANHAGWYKVFVKPLASTTNCPQLFSDSVFVKVDVKPVFTSQPTAPINCTVGALHTMTVATNVPSTFQWYKDGVAMSGKTLSSITVDSTQISKTYYVEAKNGVCPPVASNTVVVEDRNPSTLLSLATSKAENLEAQCKEGDWTYYAEPGNRNVFLMAINHNGNNVTFRPDIDFNTNGTKEVFDGTTLYGAVFGERLFNIDVVSGTLTAPYNVKFYYDNSELLDVANKYDARKSLPGFKALRDSMSWFTSVASAFTPSLLNSITKVPVLFPHVIQTAVTRGVEAGINFVTINNMVSNNGGGTMYLDYRITSGSGINPSNGAEAGFKMFPIPAVSNLNVEINNKTLKPVLITVTDMQGRIVMSQEVRHQNTISTHPINVSSMANGVYQISLDNGDQVLKGKFTIER